MPEQELNSVPARRGVYTADRAAQLSGVPRTTVYHWARVSKLVVPSISSKKVKLWSYHDLILLRLVAWLRGNTVGIQEVRTIVKRVKDARVDMTLRASSGRVFGPLDGEPGAIIDLLSNQVALAGKLAEMLPEFDLVASEVEELGRHKLWGPNLLQPSSKTRINPDVLSGEPFVEASRIPTSALFALRGRNLSPARIAELYELETPTVEEAIWLEASVRAGKKLPRAA